jgi:hypothetical protein
VGDLVGGEMGVQRTHGLGDWGMCGRKAKTEEEAKEREEKNALDKVMAALDTRLVGYLVRERHKEFKDFQTRICSVD